MAPYLSLLNQKLKKRLPYFYVNIYRNIAYLSCIPFQALLLNITTGPNSKRRSYRSHPMRSPIRHFAYYINVGSEVPPTTYSRYEVPRKSVNEIES
jgi:hypothetical protein